MRIDIALVEAKMFNTRSSAQDAIKEGRVKYNNKIISKNSFQIEDINLISIQEKELNFVSRAGLKLHHAMINFNVNVDGKVCYDIGASTGGFTQVLLNNNAKKVYALDVGSSQLSPIIKNDSRVINLENTNCRYLDELKLEDKADFACMDVSFISIKKIIPALLKCMSEDYECIFLIKPQFEAGKDKIGKNGIIKDSKVHKIVLMDMINYFKENDIVIKGLEVSSILGRDGNKEFVVYLSNHGSNCVIDIEKIIKSA